MIFRNDHSAHCFEAISCCFSCKISSFAAGILNKVPLSSSLVNSTVGIFIVLSSPVCSLRERITFSAMWDRESLGA